MNKKIFLISPFTVLAIGLTSCGRFWPTITDSEAKERIDAIYKEYNVDNFKNMPETIDGWQKGSSKIKIGKHSLSNSSSQSLEYDIKNNYSHVTSSIEISSGTQKYDKYDIYKDKLKYSLNNLNYTYITSEVSEEQFKNDLKSEIKLFVSQMINNVYLDKATDFDSLVKVYKQYDEDYKKNDGYFKYTFSSNDKTKNVGILIEYKYIQNAVEKVSPKKTIENKFEIRFEDNYPAFFKQYKTTKIEAMDKTPAQESVESSNGVAKYGSTITQDKINIDEYIKVSY